MCRDEAERWKFIGILVEVIQAYPDRLKVVLTIRSDFEPQIARGPVESYWQTARFVVPPMTQDELREAIEKPASERVLYSSRRPWWTSSSTKWCRRRARCRCLSFTLSEMYIRYPERQGDDRALARVDYAALGGVIGALRHRATEEYEGLDPAHQATMRRVILRMVSLEGGEVARRRVPISELVYLDEAENQRVQRVIDGLTRARFGRERLGDREGDPYVEPAHDELVRAGTNCGTGSGRNGSGRTIWPFQRRLTQAARGVGRGEGREAGDRPSLAGRLLGACCWSRCSSRAMLGPIK